MNIIDEYTRECQVVLIARKITSKDVIVLMFNLFMFRGIPKYIRSDNGPEFTAEAIRKWLNKLGMKTLFIEPDSPWENGYLESFNGKTRDELLNLEILLLQVADDCNQSLNHIRQLLHQSRHKFPWNIKHSLKIFPELYAV